MVMINAIMRDPASLMHESWVNWVKNRTIHVDEESQTEARYALGVLRCRYEYWWADCSPSEKLALWHVATDRFLHASNSKLYPLLWKGLLKLAPDIQLYSRSWQLFVKQAGDRDQLAFLKPELKPSTWAKVSRRLTTWTLFCCCFPGRHAGKRSRGYHRTYSGLAGVSGRNPATSQRWDTVGDFEGCMILDQRECKWRVHTNDEKRCRFPASNNLRNPGQGLPIQHVTGSGRAGYSCSIPRRMPRLHWPASEPILTPPSNPASLCPARQSPGSPGG